MPAKKDRGRGGPAAEPQAQPAAPAHHPDDLCVLCEGAIDPATDERFETTCTLCGTSSMHSECAVEYLQLCVPIMFSNSSGQKRYAVLVKQRPRYLMQAERVPCPAGSARAKHDHAAGCDGYTIGADAFKPVKAQAAPVPHTARPAKKQQQQQQQQQQQVAGKKAAALTGGVASGRKQHRGPAGSRTNAQPTATAAAVAGSSGSGQPGRSPSTATSPVAGGGLGGGGYTKGHRPLELTLCRHVLESGRCYYHNCLCAHSEEELRQREAEFAAERTVRREQARKAEAAAKHAAAQLALNEAAAAQAVLDAIEDREMLLGISQPTLALVKSHKRAACLHTLLAYGFDKAEAESAVDAAGADPRLATQMLFNQEPCTGFQPVTVDREVQDLLTFAAELGLPSPLLTVEDQLATADGNWEAAHEALQALALHAATAATESAAAAETISWADADWEPPMAAAAPAETGEQASGLVSSQPGTPSTAAALSHWAADANSTGGTSTSTAAHSPNTPPSEAASDGGGSWPQPSSAAGSTTATPSAAAGPGSDVFAEPHTHPHLQSQPEPQPPLPMMPQLPGPPAAPSAGFEGFMPGPPQKLASPAPFGSPVPIPGRVQPPPAAAPADPAPPAAYPALMAPSAGPSEYVHGFQAGLAAAMRQLQQSQQAQQHQMYGQYQQHQQSQYGGAAGQPAGHASYQQPASHGGSQGAPFTLAPEAYFPAAQQQTKPWQQQPGAQQFSPPYQHASSNPVPLLPPHVAHQQVSQPGQPGHAQQAQQAGQAGQAADEQDAMLSLMGIA